MRFSIFRFDPDRDEKPYMQDFDIALEATDHMLLDVILRLKIRVKACAARTRSTSTAAMGWPASPG
jgi:succinate dehydrogenase/fumarate reductase-like Fe-S protein